MGIINLPELIESLSENKRALFNRIFDVSINTGKFILPDTMRKWAEQKFGKCEEQVIVRVTNKVTYEGTLFNELRSKRPIDVKAADELEKIIKETEGGPFCNPETQTPSDVFGRIRGKYCITASNIAKYDYLHAVLIFKDHNPFVYEEEKITDYIETAMKWIEKAYKYDKKAIYPFFMWNCLWRAAASIVHGHAQVLVADKPYSRAEFVRNAAEKYQSEYGTDYFDDLYTVHESLGLGFRAGDVRIVSNLTPIKEKEIIMLSEGVKELPYCVSRTLKCYYRLGVRSFTFAIFMPPIVEIKGWEKFPYITRIVDRGDPMSRTTDIGAMELYAGHSVVSSDPFRIIEELRSEFDN